MAINDLNRHSTVDTALLGPAVIKNTPFTVTGVNIAQQTKRSASKWKGEAEYSS